MIENENTLIEETAAAMRDLGRTVTDAPPLRLAPRPQARAARPAPRRWGPWAAPLTAMAAVIVLAISLVVVRDVSNGHGTPPARPAPAASGGTTSASPGWTAIATSPAGTATTAPASTAPPATTPATVPATGSTAPTPAGSAAFVPMETATGGEFYSPSGNINCEVDNWTNTVVAYCQTTTPARSVHMDASGQYTVCTGVQCLGNAGEHTPTLAYGTETGVGPFTCVSATDGVTCTIGDGKGFLINTAGITAVPST
jgi:hypothetical protein